MSRRPGTFVISLDFELHWGVHDSVALDVYRENLLGVRQAVPEMLRLFQQYEIHATWATVGFLFFSRREELHSALPQLRPSYDNQALSPYALLEKVGACEQEDPLHYAASLLELIGRVPGQEIGTHTFSHYLCREAGQTRAQFAADMRAAVAAAERIGVKLESLVFPRNQVNPDYLPVCNEEGIGAYRGNQPAWMYRGQSIVHRACRIADVYLNLSGQNGHQLEPAGGSGLVNVRGSRFLRPWSRRLRLLEPLRLRRMRREMTDAARRGLTYHLWWHPHNFGSCLEENLRVLESLLRHFAALRRQYGMQSLGMSEAARAARQEVCESFKRRSQSVETSAREGA
jgi:peptidoglycan/xylan/chitin deacetylase (PgdA/CDA1 family)